jgi:hypothetical protein
MSRRRAQKQQEKEEFLDQNPELIEYETVVRVVENDAHAPTAFSAVGSQNGGPEYTFVHSFGVGEDPPEATIGQFVDDPEFYFGASGGGVSLSEAGIGVGSSADEPGFDSIEGNEFLRINMSPDNPDYPGSGPSPTEVDTFGGERLEIEFTATGQGNVQFEFLNVGSNGFDVYQSDSISGRSNGEYEFGVELPNEGLFNYADISTTGTLEISIVGLTLGTNFESGFDPFATI